MKVFFQWLLIALGTAGFLVIWVLAFIQDNDRKARYSNYYSQCMEAGKATICNISYDGSLQGLPQGHKPKQEPLLVPVLPDQVLPFG